MRRSKTCLLTVATDDFIPGTFVMVRTFLKHHPRFDGDVVIVHDGLSDASREVLAASFHRLRFEPVSPELRDRVARLCAVRPEIRARRAAFYILDAFRLHGYRKVLCCDGDLLFRASVEELFDSPEALICCRDQFSLRSRRRDAVTYLPADDPAVPVAAPAASTLAETFNSGFLLLDGRLMGEGAHADLLARVSPEAWRGVKAVAADQLVLNRCFAGRQTLVSSTYNYLVDCSDAIRAREGIGVEDARVLHFKLPMKPWAPDAMLYWARRGAARTLAPGYKLWYDAYVDCLADAHLRHALDRPGIAVVSRNPAPFRGPPRRPERERFAEAPPRRGPAAAANTSRAERTPPSPVSDASPDVGDSAPAVAGSTRDFAQRNRQATASAVAGSTRDSAQRNRQATAPAVAPRPSRVCLVTGTTDGFVPGTFAMLGTFLKHHPRFDGEVVVIHDGLSAASREALAPLSERLRFEPVSPELRDRLARLSAEQPRLRDRLAHFYSLEAFRLHGYRKVLYCDGDLLFRAPIAELFDSRDALICCGDSPHLRGLPRDAVTYLPVEDPFGRRAPGGRPSAVGSRPEALAGESSTLAGTFNSGLLLIDEGLVRAGCYAGLLEMVSGETWRRARVRIADQLVLNRYFAGRRTLVSSTYNYLLPQAGVIRAREGIGIRNAKVLHFRAPFKPWRPDAMLAWAGGKARDAMTPGFKLWYGAYVDCLAAVRLRNAFRRSDAHRSSGAAGAAG